MATNVEKKKQKIGRHLLELRGTLHLLQDMFDRGGPDEGPIVIEIGKAAEIAQSIDRLSRLVFKIYDKLPHWQPAA